MSIRGMEGNAQSMTKYLFRGSTLATECSARKTQTSIHTGQNPHCSTLLLYCLFNLYIFSSGKRGRIGLHVEPAKLKRYRGWGEKVRPVRVSAADVHSVNSV